MTRLLNLKQQVVTELADVEAAEIQVIEAFLPLPSYRGGSRGAHRCNYCKVGASAMADMGKVMGALKSKVQGRADMGAIGAMIRAKLQ